MSWLSSLFKSNTASQDASAATLARMEREKSEREAKVREGQSGIDSAFSLFDPAYYDKFRQTYTDFYTPQIGDQYAKAKDQLTATLAGRGTLESTVGASKFGDLNRTRADSEADIANRGVDASNELKSKVEGAKTNLYTLNTSAADPSLASAQAIGAASTLVAPSSYSPLGQVFSSLAQSLGNYNKGDATSMNPRLPWNTAAYGSAAPLSGRGSSIYG